MEGFRTPSERSGVDGGPPERHTEPEVPAPLPPVVPVQPVVQHVPEQPKQVVMSHPETVTLPPTQEVLPTKPLTRNKPEVLTPVNQKELTPVKQSAPENLTGNLTNKHENDKNPVKKSVETLPAPTAKKLPKKMQFKGKKGRQRTEAEVKDLLTFVQNRGAWPNDNYVSEQMRRYYKREYPEYFRKLRKGKKVQSHGSSPIDLQSRRTGTGNN